jgi:YVTN family beta-propeller protein
MKKLLLLLPIVLYAQVIDTVIPLFDEPREQLFYIPEGNKLYINLDETRRFFVLDCSTNIIRKIIQLPLGYPSAAYAVWNWRRNKIYYSFSPALESIVVIDNQRDSIIKWINWYASPPCYNSKDDKVYTNNGDSLAVIDCETDSIINIIGQPYYLAHFSVWDSIGNKVYCGSSWTDKVTVINCANDSVVAVISSGVSTPYGAVYNPQRRKLYVGGYWGLTGAVIDAVGDTLIKNFYPMPYADDIPLIYNSLEDKVYWPGEFLCVIDCLSDSIIKRVDTGVLWHMCLAGWSNRLYITSGVHDSTGYFDILSVLDCRNDSVVSQLRLGDLTIMDMTCNPNNHRIYVLDKSDSSLYVIRDEIPGVEEHQTLNASRSTLEVYPNPARSVIRVRVPLSIVGGVSQPRLRIFDVSGS